MPPKAKISKFDVLAYTSQGAPPVDLTVPRNIRIVPVDRIRPGFSQYRLHFSEQDLDDLAKVFQEHGINDVVWVEPDPEDSGYFRLINGERTWRAAQKIGAKALNANVLPGLTEAQRAECAYLANETPKRLNLIEDTLAILDILSKNLGLSHEETKRVLYTLNNAVIRKKALNHDALIQQHKIERIFDRLRCGCRTWTTFTRSRLPLLSLPEDVMEAVQGGKLDATTAQRVAKLEDPKARQKLLAEAIQEKLSYRDVRSRVKAMQPPTPPPPVVQRWQAVGRQISRNPAIARDTAKAKRIADLLSEVEALLKSEE